MVVFAVMPVFYLLIFFFLLPKSARFLFSAGRNEEAKKALLKIGKRFPKRNINEEFVKQVEFSTMECFQNGKFLVPFVWDAIMNSSNHIIMVLPFTFA